MRKPSDTPGDLYLGARYDTANANTTNEAVHIPSSDLVTHGVCIGMTGSGKTGLCISLLEECALADIPVLIIDPKGDLTNLALVFPELDAPSFLPWVREEDARRRQTNVGDLAASEAAKWKAGLADWGIDSERMRHLKNHAEVTLFTPGSSAGVPLDVLHSFDPPGDAADQDPELLREQIAGAVSALLGMLERKGVTARSREHILMATILEERWLSNQPTTLTDLINLIQSPPLSRLGAIPLDEFFPPDDRRQLAHDLNALVASPSFQVWLEGEPLDIAQLLRTPDGRPRLSVCTISHLSDAQRMFFVTLLLNQFISWMRRQPGTSDLRALLYFDEIFGYLPPHPHNPPSKKLLMTLLKQGRAFGTSAMLVSQNPVDLDYKALANCGVWMLGKMQTRQDRDRILGGLRGAVNEAGGSSAPQPLDEIMATLASRVFLIHNIHDGHPRVIHSRWAMSYLAGPMTRSQIRTLKTTRSHQPQSPDKTTNAAEPDSLADFLGAGSEEPRTNPLLLNVPPAPPRGLTARFTTNPGDGPLAAGFFAMTTIVFRDRSTGDALTREKVFLIPPPDNETATPDWRHATVLDSLDATSTPPADPSLRYQPLPPSLSSTQSLQSLGARLIPFLVDSFAATRTECHALNLKSKLDEPLESFQKRVNAALEREIQRRESEITTKSKTKIQKLQEKIDRERAELKRDREKADIRRNEELMSTAATVGSTLLSLFNSRRRSSAFSKIGTAIKRASSKRGITQRAQLEVEESERVIQETQMTIESLAVAMVDEIAAMKQSLTTEAATLTTTRILPFKSNITVHEMGFLWDQAPATPPDVAADGL